MASIAFTDSIGDAVLTNGMPISRFSNWTPLTRPVGDVATRKSDGLRMMFTERTDYAASFELRNIPMKEVASPFGLNVAATDLTDTDDWAASTSGPSAGTITRTATTLGENGEFSGYSLLADANYTTAVLTHMLPALGSRKAVIDFVFRKNGSSSTANRFGVFDSTASANEYFYSVDFSTGAVTIDSAPAHIARTVATQIGISSGVPWWRVRTELDGLDPAHIYTIYAGFAGQATISGQGLYFGDLTVSPGQRNVELADRLIAHLLGGGTCSVTTDDRDGNTYDTCGLAPGTEPSLTLADDQLLEYTLSLALINLDASPSQMVCRYA